MTRIFEHKLILSNSATCFVPFLILNNQQVFSNYYSKRSIYDS